MKLDQITEQHLAQVHRMYELHCGLPGTTFQDRMGYSLAEALRELGVTGGFTYVVGSRWSDQTKILALTGTDGKVNFHAFEDPHAHPHRNYTEQIAPSLSAFREATERILKE